MGIARRQIRWNGWGWTAHRDALANRETIWRWLAKELGMPALLATPARALEDITLPVPSLAPEQIAAFAAILGADRVTQDDYERAFHAGGRSYHDLLGLRSGDLSGAPDAVLYPRGEEEVLAVLQLAARERIGVVPFGGGTGTGESVKAGRGHVTIDLSGMDHVREIDIQSGTVLAEAGITSLALEKALAMKGFGLTRTPMDCEFSSLGGRIAAKDGAASDVISARLATPMGMLDTKNLSGPDLKYLLPGSQGALGIITQARLRIRTAFMPRMRAFQFHDFSSGFGVLRDAARANLAHAMLHLLDAEETRFELAFAALDQPEGLVQRLRDAWAGRHWKSGGALLIASFPDDATTAQFETLAQKRGATALGEEPAKRWMQARLLTPYNRDSMLDRGLGIDRLDIPASWSALPALYTDIRAALDRAMRENALRAGAHGLVLCHVAQARIDGATLCFTTLFARQLENEIAQAQTIRQAGLAAANPGETQPLGIAALRGLKNALDPQGILNPGKIDPASVMLPDAQAASSATATALAAAAIASCACGSTVCR